MFTMYAIRSDGTGLTASFREAEQRAKRLDDNAIATRDHDVRDAVRPGRGRQNGGG